MSGPSCAYCGRVIGADEPYDQRVVGWERKAGAASRKSGSDILLRERRDEFAHRHCVDTAARGLAPTQAAMPV
jgi:hypothetical protein